MQLLSCIAVVATAIASSSIAAAWTISSTDATLSEDIVRPHQEYTKSWTVVGSGSLSSLNLAAVGPVFVDVDASLAPEVTEAPATPTAPVTEPVATIETGSGSGSSLRSLPVLTASADEKVVARIVFSGNCTKLLDLFKVVDHDGDVKVHFQNQPFEGYGYVLTQVYVAEEKALTTVKASGDSSVYVSENVIASAGNATEVSLLISGSGAVFITAPTTDFSIKSLDLKILGDGKIQFNASSLSLSDSLSSKVSGDGDIAVLASGVITVNNSVSTSISGDGNVYVQAAEIKTFELSTKINGDGYVALSPNGTCESQDISVSGSGTVRTGSIVCVNTKLKISGNGDVLVQTTGVLRVPSYIDGKVQYVGTAPQQITDGHPPRTPRVKKPRSHHGFWWSHDDNDSDSDSSDDFENDDHYLPKSVTQATENTYKVYEAQAVPARDPVFIALSLRPNGWREDPNTRYILIIGGVDIGGYVSQSAQNMATTVKTHVGSNVVGYVGVAGVAAVVAGVALRKHAARRRRREYSPLLQVSTGRN